MEDDPNFFGKGKRTSILLKMEAGFFFVMEDNLNLFVKGRQPSFFINRRQTQFLSLMEDDFKFVCKWKTISICL